MRAPLPLLLLALVAPALPASALPASQAWRAPGLAPTTRSLALVLERDATSVTLVSATPFAGDAKLARRLGDEGGLLFAVRDAAGRPLLVGRTHAADLVLHGDEPDETTGTLRSLSVRRERAAFLLRVPVLPGAHDVAFYEEVAAGPAPAERLVEWIRTGDAALSPLGAVRLPGAATP